VPAKTRGRLDLAEDGVQSTGLRPEGLSCQALPAASRYSERRLPVLQGASDQFAQVISSYEY